MSFLLSTLDSSLLSLGGDLWSPFDIMDADGTIGLPIAGGKHLEGDVVGSHFADYDSVVNLAQSHDRSAGRVRCGYHSDRVLGIPDHPPLPIE
jgi:hypothetical protein